MHWSQVYGIKFNSLRLFNVYGPRSRTSGTYGAFLVYFYQKIANMPFVVGDGKQQRFCICQRCADAFYRSAIANVYNEIFNIGSNNSYSINYLVKLIGGRRYIFQKDLESLIQPMQILKK